MTAYPEGEYELFSKCRLCGQEVSEGITNYVNAMQIVYYIATGRREELYRMIGLMPHIVGNHECKSGSIGVTDFQGARKR